MAGIGYYAFKNGQIKLSLSQQARLSPTLTQDITASWKTYKNTDLGIEFLYRPDLSVKYDLSKNKVQIFNSKNNSPDVDSETFFVAELTPINIQYLPLKEYALNSQCGQMEAVFQETYNISCKELVQKSLQEYKNNQVVGVKYKFFDYVKVIFTNNDEVKYYEFSTWTEEGSDGPAKLGLKTFDQILSTFKFLD